MTVDQQAQTSIESIALHSDFLDRTVQVDLYRAGLAKDQPPCLLLLNDGQDLPGMNFSQLLEPFANGDRYRPLIVAGIHCGPDRINEYGLSSQPDYKGRGAKAASYERFILSELLPKLNGTVPGKAFTETAFAGFSLGALSALGICWNHPEIFSRAGVFSGSLWWRSLSQDDKDYDQWKHRLMHRQVREASFRPGMKFFFECGELDEAEDRNKNGVIDSIDDAIDLMRELVRKGYREGRDFYYLQLPHGRHDTASWAKALPRFLQWGWGKR